MSILVFVFGLIVGMSVAVLSLLVVAELKEVRPEPIRLTDVNE